MQTWLLFFTHTYTNTIALCTAKLIYQSHTHIQPFYSPFAGTTRVSRCQKRTSGLYRARED